MGSAMVPSRAEKGRFCATLVAKVGENQLLKFIYRILKQNQVKKSDISSVGSGFLKISRMSGDLVFDATWLKSIL